MSLTIQERLKDLRVERKLTLKDLEAVTGLSSSALGSYETDEYKDISHYALVKLATMVDPDHAEVGAIEKFCFTEGEEAEIEPCTSPAVA